MSESRKKRAKLNIMSTFLRQLVSTLCGVIVPRVMIGAFGSIAYGATTSIAQFLSYISLFEGGIGRVARGALYKPLADNDHIGISRVYQTIKGFFKKIAGLFLVYCLVIALFYYDIADIEVFSRPFTFALVIAISLSTFATYMGGIANMTLLHANQRQYLTNTIIMLTNIFNTLAIVVLVSINANILVVKLFSSLVFIIRPIMYAYFVRKNFNLTKEKADDDVLSQKWTGMGQHIAYFLHTNTDVVLLTLFADLKYVAVYSVYHLIINSIWNIASSFSGGMESAFGEMLAKKEKKEFHSSYGRYKVMLTLVTIILFGTTGVLLIPFVKLYMSGVTDANYIQPMFGMLLLAAEAMNCIALPCSSMPVAANKLLQTRWGSYFEAIINIVLSCILIQWNPLLGVAIGTLAATAFKCIYYITYAAKNFLKCSAWKLIMKFGASILILLGIGISGMLLFSNVVIDSYLVWCLWGVVIFFCVSIIALLFCSVIFPSEMSNIWKSVFHKIKRFAR